MNLSCRARKLNNKGVSLLQSGNYNLAISSFKTAFDSISNTITASKKSAKDDKLNNFSLKWVKIYGSFHVENDRSSSPLNIATRRCRTISRPVRRHQQQEVLQERSSQNVDFQSHPPQHRQTREMPSGQLEQKKGSSHRRSFVYKRALTMEESFEGRPALEKSAIILFNLALGSHLLALTGGAGKNKLLNMALTVYARASNFLKMETVEDDEYSRKTKAFHVVALNNVGQIYYELGRFKQAMSCFRHVSAALDTLEDQDAIDERERDGILLNIMTLKQPVLAAAA